MPNQNDSNLRESMCAWLQWGREFLDDDGMRDVAALLAESVRAVVTDVVGPATPRQRKSPLAPTVRRIVAEMPGLTTGEIAQRVMALDPACGPAPNVHLALAYGIKMGRMRYEGAYGARRYYAVPRTM